MKTPSAIISCDCCNGTGKRPLCADFQRTLDRLVTFGAATTSELQEVGVSRNAINNRLIYLERHKLVTRIGKTGKYIIWKAKK